MSHPNFNFLMIVPIQGLFLGMLFFMVKVPQTMEPLLVLKQESIHKMLRLEVIFPDGL